MCGLYIHTPFCETKCGYCDFYSVALKGRRTAPLVDALIRELEIRLADNDYAIRTIFIGGGTPTLLPIDDLSRLLRRVGELVDPPESPLRKGGGAGECVLSTIEEFTVEANPATVDAAKADLLVSSGVTRVSMGAQSFFPVELAALERLHSPDDIAPSVEVLRRGGIRQINLDLIFGIPGQTLATWNQSLRRAIDLGIDHLACYGLTYEPGTRLTAQRSAGRVTPCDEDLEADMYLGAIDILQSAGFEQYEISNFAKPGCQCRHNLIYWRNEPYIGVGPSAAGCVDNRRHKNVADIGQYVQMIRTAGCAEAESEVIEGESLVCEMILMQLRLNEGLSIDCFRDRTGLDPIGSFGETLRNLVEHNLVAISPTHIALTRSGMMIANRIMADLAAATQPGSPGTATIKPRTQTCSLSGPDLPHSGQQWPASPRRSYPQ